MQKTILSCALCATIILGSTDKLRAEETAHKHSTNTIDVSLIVDSSFVSRDISDDEASHLEIPEVVHGLFGSDKHDEHAHSTYNAKNGFNINYAELLISGSVNSALTLNGVFHFSEGGVNIEEAYFSTTALGYGLNLKGGKFKSNFGYINQQHHHRWSFADAPLVFEAFLGMHGINENGLQLQWNAPTSTHLMLGVEILQGENEYMFGNSSIGNLENPIAKSTDAPSLLVAYIKTSFDIKDSTILAGLSYANGDSRIDNTNDEESPYAFSGTSKLYGLDLLVKHDLNSHSSIIWQSEWLKRDMQGTKYNIDLTDANVVTRSSKLDKVQSGIYSQLTYTYNQHYKFAIRYESIYQNDVEQDGTNLNLENNFDKYSAMAEYHASEFAFFRIQYNKNNALYNEDSQRQSINTLIFQVNISIGSHREHNLQ